jgi:hypothetical protein
MSGLDSWTGSAIGEGVTLAALYARTQPDTDAPTVTLWASGTTLLLWDASGLWYWCSDLACKTFGWSHGAHIRRTL